MTPDTPQLALAVGPDRIDGGEVMLTRGRPAYRRQAVLAFVDEAIASEGVAPSYRMIRSALGIRSDGEVRRIVAALTDAGQLRRVGNGKVRRIRRIMPSVAMAS